MMFLAGRKVHLRSLKHSDLDFLYRWENDPAVWEFGDCGAENWDDETRFTREELRQFIENQEFDIHTTEQLRLVICVGEEPIGFVDLFDYDKQNSSAGIGIIICDEKHRRQGYGIDTLELMIDYAQRVLGIETLWSDAAKNNKASIALFKLAGFDGVEEGEFIHFYKKKLPTFAGSLAPFLSP